MNLNNHYILSAIFVSAAITFMIRVIPFILFGKGKTTPLYVTYIGKYLPLAIMSMLIVYCLRNVQFSTAPFGIPEAIGIIAVAALHLWKRNNLISILGGTLVYMVSIQFIFA